MLRATLLRTAATMSPAERVGLRDYIDTMLGAHGPNLTVQQRTTIQQRATQMEADPSIGVDWDDVYAELMADLA